MNFGVGDGLGQHRGSCVLQGIIGFQCRSILLTAVEIGCEELCFWGMGIVLVQIV